MNNNPTETLLNQCDLSINCTPNRTFFRTISEGSGSNLETQGNYFVLMICPYSAKDVY